MPDYYFHYTSRPAAQGIANARRMEAGASGFIFVTPDVYQSGAEAADRLSIPSGRSIDAVALIPAASLTTMSPIPPGSLVWPLTNPVNGRTERRGGGAEILVPGPLPATDVCWLTLSPP